jgi:SAM-dependent methyltransferase
MASDHRLVSERFPRSSKYHPDWVIASASGGANSLWLIEWLAERLDLEPGMRVLDLGCGLAASSIFLRREYGVQVWATDLWFGASAVGPRSPRAGHRRDERTIERRRFRQAAEPVTRDFARRWSPSLRESVSARDNGWSAVMCDADANEMHRSEHYDVRLVDRVVGGDSSAGGLTYGLVTSKIRA